MKQHITLLLPALLLLSLGAAPQEEDPTAPYLAGVKERFSAAVRDLRDADYETMLTSNEDGERTRILVRIEDDLIRELVIVTTGDDNALVRIKGKISPADVERVINEHANGDS